MKKQEFYYSWDDIPVIIDMVLTARILGMSYEWVKKKCREGDIPNSKFNQEVRIQKEDLKNWLESKKRKGA